MDNFLKEEKGVVFVEATLVFPIMFFALFIMIFFGNAYYLRSRVDNIITQETILGAAYCSDPELYSILSGGGVPTKASSVKNDELYVFEQGATVAKGLIKSETEAKLNAMGPGFFIGMKPVITSLTVKCENYAVNPKFTVETIYTVQLPMKLFMTDNPVVLRLHSRCEKPINNESDLIRNLDMVEDLYVENGAGWINRFCGRVRTFLQ